MQRGIKFEGRPVWAEIRLSALVHNLRAIRRRLHAEKAAQGKSGAASKIPTPKILAVVKANAYGHGAVPVARALQGAGADWFGVTCSAEGIELRESGIRKPILLLTGFWPGEERRLLAHRLTPTIIRCEQLRTLEKAAARVHRGPAAFHLKIQTGMNRLGMSRSELSCLARTLADCPHLRLEGIFTHFASSEVFSDDKAEEQQKEFAEALGQLRLMGITAPLVHMANSAAVASRPASWGTMVRPGLVLYGYHQYYDPSPRTDEANSNMPLRPALALRARLISLRDVPTGQGVGYNGRWVAQRASRIAVISAGYADGLPRTLLNRGRVIIRGHFAPLVGSISMDLVTADVTDVPDVRLGDVATFYGADGKASLYVSEVAQEIGTVTSELCCAIGQRVPRFYLP
jgi:alanine racemase